MKQDSLEADELDQIFMAVAAAPATSSPVIACLYSGNLPEHCAPMPRDPSPATGQRIDRNFGEVLAEATKLNQAVHDGAIMAARADEGLDYRLSGWSFRLLPPDGPEAAVVNRGSAFHSSLAMSCVARVERVYLVTKGSALRFQGGSWLTLC